MSTKLFHRRLNRSRLERSLVPALVLLINFCALPHPASAEPEIKRNVIKNCPAALEQLPQVPPEQKDELLSYLGRILETPSNALQQLMEESTPPLPQPGNLAAPRDPFKGSVWLSFDPSREIEAKRCAVELLVKSAPLSFEFVPEISILAEDKTLPGEFRNYLSDSAWSITTAAAKDDTYNVPVEVLNWVYDQLTTASSYFAENVLIELHRRTVPYLLEQLKSADYPKRQKVREVLLRIDSDGSLIGPRLLDLLDSGDAELRQFIVDLLGELPGFYAQSFAPLIRRSADPALEVREAVYDALEKIFPPVSGEKQFSAAPEAIAALISELQKPLLRHRPIVERALLQLNAVNMPAVQDQLALLTQSIDADLRLLSLRLLAGVRSPKPDLLLIFYKAEYDSSLLVRLAAIDALGKRPERAEEVTASFLRLLKSNISTLDELAKQQTVLKVAQAAASLPVVRNTPALIPYFVEALGFEKLRLPGTLEAAVENEAAGNQAVAALSHLGAPAINPVLKVLQARNAVRPRFAVQALILLPRLTPLDRSAVKTVVSMLKDSNPDVRSQAQRSIKTIGKPAEPELERALDWKEPEARYAAAAILTELGDKNAKTTAVLEEAFERSQCLQKIEIAPAVSQLLAPEQRSEAPALLLIHCLGDESVDRNDLFGALTAFSPLTSAAAAELVKTAKAAKDAPALELEIAEQRGRFGITDDLILQMLSEIIDGTDNAVRAKALEQVGELGAAAAAASGKLKAIYDNSDEEIAVRHAALGSLIKIDPAALNYAQILTDELEGEHFHWAQEAMVKIGPEKALPVLMKALNDLSIDKKYRALRPLGRLGEAAKPAADEVSKLLNNSFGSLQYHALVTLLRIDPQRPEIVPALRREIRSANLKRLAAEKLPPSAQTALESIAQSRDNFVECRAAEDLLQKIRALSS